MPSDNPFVGDTETRPEIWSYGHRNIQAAALDPHTGTFWIAEVGPDGGDELNRVEAGRNYGWPLVSQGRHYDGAEIPLPSIRPDLADAVHQWTPAIAPSGLTIYAGDLFPSWRGSLLVGSVRNWVLVRVTLEHGRLAGEEHTPLEARVRDVRQGPEGAVYALTDEAGGSCFG